MAANSAELSYMRLAIDDALCAIVPEGDFEPNGSVFIHVRALRSKTVLAHNRLFQKPTVSIAIIAICIKSKRFQGP